MKRKGFTLIELMVVIAIVAILLAIALPLWHRTGQKAGISNEPIAKSDCLVYQDGTTVPYRSISRYKYDEDTHKPKTTIYFIDQQTVRLQGSNAIEFKSKYKAWLDRH